MKGLRLPKQNRPRKPEAGLLEFAGVQSNSSGNSSRSRKLRGRRTGSCSTGSSSAMCLSADPVRGVDGAIRAAEAPEREASAVLLPWEVVAADTDGSAVAFLRDRVRED